MMKNTLKLYRPVGLKEMELILLSKGKAFPPRLSWQPIFYPVLNFDYAAQIAHQWNTQDEFSGYCGFVTSFEIDKAYVQQFEVQNVGADIHNELWIPAEELKYFNEYISGYIQIEKAWYDVSYTGVIENTFLLKKLDAEQQWEYITQLKNYELPDFVGLEYVAVMINYPYWERLNLDSERLREIKSAWYRLFPEWALNA